MMKRTLTLAWRIGVCHYEADEAFSRVFSALTAERPAIADEVALFDSLTHHLYVPLETYGRRMAVVERRLAEFRRAGVRAGINVLTTLGHVNEAWSYMEPLPFQPMIDSNGVASTGCACPNTPELRAYVRAKYTLAAQARPEFIWVDDDLRMHHHGGMVNGVWGGSWNCFCPTCLATFSAAAAAGRTYSREKLIAAFNVPENGELRRAWVRFNAESLRSLLAEVKETVRAVDSRMVLGFMTAGVGWSTYAGPDFAGWFAALDATKARPGGGFYSDETPVTMYGKALDVGLQRAFCPEAVDDVQYELENFPYQALKKSIATLRNECTLALAVGHNGIAMNVLGLSGEDYGPILRAVGPARAEWAQLVAHGTGLPTCGLWPAWAPGFMGKHSLRPGESWPGHVRGGDNLQARVFGEIGLPLGVDGPGECGTVLSGRLAEGFDDEELRRLLSGGVLMDSDTLDILQRRGLADLAGASIAKRLDNGVVERLSGDPLNGDTADSLRDARIEFWGDATGQADRIEPGPDTRVLARMEDYFGRDQGPCMTAYENALGGRVVVMGYAPWMFIHSAVKRRQLQNLADWIARGRLPVRVLPAVRLIPLVRLSGDRRRGTVVLLNAGCDAIDHAEIDLRIPPETPVRRVSGPAATPVPTRPTPAGITVTLQHLPPWTTVTLLLGE